MARNFDMIVIGAGPGGATLASLTANEKKKVLVIDKNPSAGGRMMTVHKDGHSYEMFPLNLIPNAPSRFEELQERLNKKVRNVAAEFDDKINVIYIDPQGEHHLLDFKDKNCLKDLGIRNPLQLIRVVSFFTKHMKMKEEDIKKLGNISAYDYMQQQKVPDAIKLFITAYAGEGAFEMTSDMVPASNMVRILQLTMSKDHAVRRYYEGGIGGFFSKMLETVPENGGELLFNTRVSRILVEDGKAVGVVTETGEEYRAPIVASSAGVRQTAKFLVGEENLPREYVDSVMNLHSNLCDVGYRYFTTKKVLPYSTYVLFPYNCLESWADFEKMANGEKKPVGNYIHLGTKSVFPTIAPEDGGQVIYAVMSCVPKYDQDFTQYLEYIEKRVATIFPELYEEGVIQHKEIMSLKTCTALGVDPIEDGIGGESYGISASIGQSDDDTPKAETPIAGLYIVGNDSEGFGVGTHRAVDSGFKVFKKIKHIV